jgi:DNA-directed RNA polymerase specialized sigma54-like protein
MSCGCKKNKNTQVVNQPTEITVTIDEALMQQDTNVTLTEEQQKTVDEIISKLNQVSS